jgi:hypothetical protein
MMAAKRRHRQVPLIKIEDLNVRFGSKADICGATSHAALPDSDRESGFLRKVMSKERPAPA